MRVGMGLLRSKSGTYYVRKKVPKQLEQAAARALDNGKDRQTFLKKSLRTKDLAEAKRKAPAVLMQFDGVLARATALASAQPLRAVLAQSEIDRMGAYYFALQLSNHDEYVRLGPTNERGMRELVRDIDMDGQRDPEEWSDPVPSFGLSGGQMLEMADGLAELLPEAEAALARGNIAHVEHQIERVLEAFQMRLEPTSDAYGQLGTVILRQHVLALRAIKSRSEGEPIVTPRLPEVGAVSVIGGETLRAAFAGWEKERDPSPRTHTEYERAIRLFIEMHGDLPIVQLRRRHALRFREALQDVPQKRKGKLLTAPLPELAQWGGEHPEVRKLSSTTVNKLLGGVQAVGLWARDRGLIPEDVPWSDPFANMRLPEDTPERESFTTRELQTLFADPVFTEGGRPNAGQGEAAFWMPLLALFTGARRGELAGLTVADVPTAEVTGARVLVFKRDSDRGKTLKNKGSARTVPIHPELARLGFLQFVEDVRRARGKDAWLFPVLAPERGDEGVKAWTKWFHRRLRELGVTDRHKVFHSFRHNFKDALRAAKVGEDLNDALTGHSNGSSVGRGYGAKNMVQRFGLATLVDAVSKVSYPGLDLSAVSSRGAKRRNKTSR
jgi:integrase